MTLINIKGNCKHHWYCVFCNVCRAVTIHWTGLLDWNWTTGLKFFPFLDKIMWFFKYLTPGDFNYYFLETSYRISVILQQQYNDFMTVVVLLAFSNALANKLMIMTSQGII